MKTLTLQDLEEFVCREFKIKPEELKGKSRKMEYVYPRMLFCYLIKLYSKTYSYASIGRFLNKDHSTIIHAEATIKDLLDSDRALRKAIANVKSRLENILNPPLEYYPYAS